MVLLSLREIPDQQELNTSSLFASPSSVSLSLHQACPKPLTPIQLSPGVLIQGKVNQAPFDLTLLANQKPL